MSLQVSGAVSQLQWLRNLLDDAGAPQVEISTATGAQVEFFVSAPPIASLTVYINGVQIASNDSTYGWSIPATLDEVIFINPPPVTEEVTLRYTTQTWTDTELNSYLLEAQTEYVKDRHVVYRAAIFAIDTMLIGTAMAFDFGAGQENYAFTSVFSRLQDLRNQLEEWLEANAEEGILEVVRVNFPSIEPGDLRDDPAGQPWSGSAGIFPDSVGGMGGLD